MKIQPIGAIVLAILALIIALLFYQQDKAKFERWVAKEVDTEWGKATIELLLYQDHRFNLELRFDGENRSQKENGQYVARSNEVELLYSSGHKRTLRREGDTLTDIEESPSPSLTRVR